MAALPKKIAVIIGSTRVNRVGAQVSDFIKATIAAEETSIPVSLTLVDVKTFNLPVYNEPILPASVPAQAQFTYEHSKAWNAEIEKYDAYVFVSAEYNYGVPGGIKNAIDYLYHSWIGKPILIVSYGIFGGVNASNALKITLEGMNLRVVETRPMFEFPERDPAQHNMSPGVMAAIGGKLEDFVVKDWRTKAGDLVKGYHQLVGMLE